MNTRKDFEGRIIAQAWKDAEYKKKLLGDPTAAFNDELLKLDPDAKLPDGLNIKVLEESAEQYYLVIPRNPREMAETKGVVGDDLDAIAPQTVAVVVAVVAAAAANVAAAANANLAANANAAANVNTI